MKFRNLCLLVMLLISAAPQAWCSTTNLAMTMDSVHVAYMSPNDAKQPTRFLNISGVVSKIMECTPPMYHVSSAPFKCPTAGQSISFIGGCGPQGNSVQGPGGISFPACAALEKAGKLSMHGFLNDQGGISALSIEIIP